MAEKKKGKPGPKKGYKQSPEHIEKRKRFGPEHHQWKGDDIAVRSGRSRALRAHAPEPCESCGAKKGERHHIDGDTANNDKSNISFMCRKCHMREDGRYDKFIELAKRNQPKACEAAAQLKRDQTLLRRRRDNDI